tara:strand:+ start:108 stop:608 length:501 start_codon:yes stop_codon:yes gene_type:complete
MNTLKTISENQTTNTLKNEFEELSKLFVSCNGISLVENKTISKTPKDKILNSINKEIEILNNRNSLELKTFKKGEKYINKNGIECEYLNDRVENRFHKNPINNIVSFNLKYKGMILPINNNNQSFSCENSVEILIINYKKFYKIIENLKNNHQLFQLDLFKSKSKK